jgi:hypothetical protein
MRRVRDPAYNGNGVGRVTSRGVGDSLAIFSEIIKLELTNSGFK